MSAEKYFVKAYLFAYGVPLLIVVPHSLVTLTYLDGLLILDDIFYTTGNFYV